MTRASWLSWWLGWIADAARAPELALRPGQVATRASASCGVWAAPRAHADALLASPRSLAHAAKRAGRLWWVPAAMQAHAGAPAAWRRRLALEPGRIATSATWLCSWLCAWLCCMPCALQAQAAGADSFRVHEAGAQVFVVERARGDGRGVEGFVVDKNALVQTLRSRVLEVQGLGNLAHVAAVADPNPRMKSAYWSGAYAFKHRFSDPFGAVEAQLDLAPLDDEGAFDLLFQLGALLVVAVIAGLYALYRMVAVQVRFAERRGNFVAAVSHELKTPLTAIRLYAEMLRDGMVESDDKRHEYYGTITAETERLSRLINNVLELSRLERRERPVQLVVGDVARLASEVVEVFRPHAQREGFRVEVLAEPNLPAAQFDRDALTQVLFNLLDNALKYGRGGAEHAISVRCERGNDGGVRVRVSDRGPGVEEAQLKAIFEPFYRAQNELTRTQQGTGIGLALVRGLVQRMRGQVEGRNCQPGFEVSVTLPLAP